MMINYHFNIIRNKNRVKSSNVKGYRYNTEDKTLIIEFNDGSRYLYEFVDFSQFEAIAKGDATCKTTGSNQFGSWFLGKNPSVGAAIWRWLIDKGQMYLKLSQNENYKDIMLKKIDYDKLPVFELQVDEEDDSGIRLISIVENPAISVKGFAFSEVNYYSFEEIEDEQIIVGPALIPGQKIYQEDKKVGPHFVTFTKDGIKKMVEKFNKSGSNRRINVEHTNEMVDAYIMEDWIVADEVYDKSRKYGFEVPVGTYMISVKVDDADFWKDKVKGESKFSFSIEGMLKQRLTKMSKEFTIDDLEESDLFEILEFIELAQGVPHYTKDGKLWTGDTHKDAEGRLMTGKVHTKESEYLYHEKQLAKVDDEGRVKPSKKAPKSDTPNPNPKGEGTAKGDAGSTRGAKVSERVEKILGEKSDDFNEKYKEKLGFGVDKGMLKAVYQRGLGAFNVSRSPLVKSAEQWALARVNAFLYIVKNGRPENPKYDGDNDLLPKKHKKRID